MNRTVGGVAAAIAVGLLLAMNTQAAGAAEASLEADAGELICTEGLFEFDTSGEPGYGRVWAPDNSTINFQMTWDGTFSFGFEQWKTGGLVDLDLVDEAGVPVFSKSGPVTMPNYPAEDGYDWRWEDEDFPDPNSPPPPEPFELSASTTLSGGGVFRVSAYIEQTSGHGWYQDLFVSVEVVDSNGFPVTETIPECFPTSPEENFGPNDSLESQCSSQGTTDNPVDTRTGNEFMPLPGAFIDGRGPGLDLRVGYNSLDADYDGPIGHGWRHTYDMQLILNPDGTRTWIQETGAHVVFHEVEPGVWRPAARMNAELEDLGSGEWEVTRTKCEFFTFNSSGQLTQIADKNGYTTDLHYSGSPAVLDYVEDEAGRQLDFVWSSGRVDSITEVHVGPEAKRSISFTYTGGDLTTYSDIGGGDWVLGYSSHLLETVRLPRQTDPGKVLQNHYDAQGRVDWQEDELNRRTHIVYEDAASPPAGVTPVTGGTIVVEPDGDMRVDYYDSSGRRYGTTYGYTSTDEVVTAIWYDPLTNMPLYVLDGELEVWEIEYQDDFYPSLITDPLDRETQMTYNGFGQMTELIDAELVKTTWEYDSAGNLEKVISAVGSTDEAATEFKYSDPLDPGVVAGDVRLVVDGRGKEWRTSYDATTGDVLTTTDPEGNETTYEFNSIGWLRDITEPKGNLLGATPEDFTTHLLHNDYGDVTQVTNPEDEHTNINYDDNRNVEQVSNNDNEVTRYEYTDADELWKVISAWNTADESTTTYTYHPDGRRHTWSNGLSNSWTYLYDAVGRFISAEDPNNQVTSYDYDGRTLLTHVTQPGGDCTLATPLDCVSFGYDAAGQLTTIDYSDVDTPDVTYTYDDIGRRNTAVTSEGTWDWNWTGRSQLETYTDADLRAVSYVWDDTGNLTEITYPGQTQPLVYGYDDAGRMDTITDWLGNVTDVDWDENSNLDLITFPVATDNSDDFVYDNANRIESIDWLQGATSLGSISYGRDPDGLLNDSTTTGLPVGPESYGYDARNQLTTIDAQAAFTYDLAGNLTQTGDGRLQIFDPSQQLCWTSPTATTGTCASPAANATTFDYDDRGNRIEMLEADGTLSTYEFDQANRLVGAEVSDATGDQYHVVTPFTVLDTEPGAGHTGKCPSTSVQCASLNQANGYTRTIQIAGEGGLPAPGEIDAVVLNVTAKNTTVTGGADAVLSVYPADISWPWSSTLYFQDDDIVSNSLITRVDANGQIKLLANHDTDVHITVAGYFSAPVPGESNQFTTVDATNVFNSVTGAGDCLPVTCDEITPSQPAYDVKILGEAGVPDDPDVTAVAINLTVIDPAALGALLVGPTGGAFTAPLVYEPGEKTSNFAIVPIGTGGRITIGAFGGDANARIEVQGYFTGEPEANEGGFHFFEVPPMLMKTDLTPPIGNCPDEPNDECDSFVLGETRAVQITGEGGIPTENVDAVAVNFTISNTGGGFLIAWPNDGSPAPGVVTALFDGGTTTGASAIVPVDPVTGQINIFIFGAADIRIEAQGYIASGDIVTFDYDADGLRTSKTGTHTGTADYVWDRSGGLPLLLTQTVDGVDTHIVYGPGGRPLTEITGSTAHWYHADHLGSTRLVTNNTGTVVGSYTYEPYGQLADTTGPYEPLLGYAGQYTDEETGFIYLRARYYDPDTAQFISRDPIVELSGAPYSYASADPVNFVDPTGLLSWRGLVTNPILQTGTIIAVCTMTGGIGCGIANGGMIAINAADRYFDDDGFTKADLINTGIDALGALAQMRNLQDARRMADIITDGSTLLQVRRWTLPIRSVPWSRWKDAIVHNVKIGSLVTAADWLAEGLVDLATGRGAYRGCS